MAQRVWKRFVFHLSLFWLCVLNITFKHRCKNLIHVFIVSVTSSFSDSSSARLVWQWNCLQYGFRTVWSFINFTLNWPILRNGCRTWAFYCSVQWKTFSAVHALWGDVYSCSWHEKAKWKIKDISLYYFPMINRFFLVELNLTPSPWCK